MRNQARVMSWTRVLLIQTTQTLWPVVGHALPYALLVQVEFPVVVLSNIIKPFQPCCADDFHLGPGEGVRRRPLLLREGFAPPRAPQCFPPGLSLPSVSFAASVLEARKAPCFSSPSWGFTTPPPCDRVSDQQASHIQSRAPAHFTAPSLMS